MYFSHIANSFTKQKLQIDKIQLIDFNHNKKYDQINNYDNRQWWNKKNEEQELAFVLLFRLVLFFYFYSEKKTKPTNEFNTSECN